jgi:DNA polymerase I-like protein with 3'-5' exonuclease and polymerase domains
MDFPVDFEWWRRDKYPDQNEAFRCGSWIHSGQLYGTHSLEVARRVLSELPPDTAYVGHNVIADLHKMVEWGIPLARDFRLKDSVLAARLLEPQAPSKELKVLARLSGYIYDDQSDSLDPDQLLDYCGKDTFTSQQLLAQYEHDASPDQRRLLDFTYDLQRAFFAVEVAGLKLDVPKLYQKEQEMSQRLAGLLTGGITLEDVTNDNRLREMLLAIHPRPYLEKHLGFTDKGELEVNAKKVKKLPRLTKKILRILEAKEVHNYLTLFVHRPLKLKQDNDFFYPRYLLLVPKTHRRSTKPAIQNWPADARDVVRSRFTTGRMVSNDYKNLEARLFAWQAGCKKFLEALVEGGYPLIGERYLGWGKIDREHPKYKQLKAIVLAITYNMSVGLYRYNQALDGVELTMEQAKSHFDEFFHAFPEIYEELESRKAYVWQHGRVKTSIPGVSIPVPILPPYVFADSEDGEQRYRWYCKKIENFACNYPTQNLASYATGGALVDVQEYLAGVHGGWGKYIEVVHGTTQQKRLDVNNWWFPVGEIHDELLTDAGADVVEEAKEVMRACMVQAKTLKELVPGFDCPLDVSQAQERYWIKD